MLRSHHITHELARERHRDLRDAAARQSRVPSSGQSGVQIERYDVLAVVRGEAGGPGLGMEIGTEPVPWRASAEPLRVRRAGTSRRFVREGERRMDGSGVSSRAPR
jgi:hypothetical protein